MSGSTRCLLATIFFSLCLLLATGSHSQLSANQLITLEEPEPVLQFYGDGTVGGIITPPGNPVPHAVSYSGPMLLQIQLLEVYEQVGPDSVTVDTAYCFTLTSIGSASWNNANNESGSGVVTLQTQSSDCGEAGISVVGGPSGGQYVLIVNEFIHDGDNGTLSGSFYETGELYTNISFSFGGSTTGVSEPTTATPALRVVATPNPFRSAAGISFDMPEAGRAAIDVFDVHGRKVSSIHDGIFPQGSNQARWDGLSDQGQQVPAGVYFIRVASRSAYASTKVLKTK